MHLQYLGFPIANDPIYCNDHWGSDVGRGGVSAEQAQVVAELLATDIYPHPDEDLKGITALGQELAESIDALAIGKDVQERPVPEPENIAKNDEAVDKVNVPADVTLNCSECVIERMDPIPQQLGIWLHSAIYESLPKGEGWKHETPKPAWAYENFDGDLELMERFWKYGGKWDGMRPGAIEGVAGEEQD